LYSSGSLSSAVGIKGESSFGTYCDYSRGSGLSIIGKSPGSTSTSTLASYFLEGLPLFFDSFFSVSFLIVFFETLPSSFSFLGVLDFLVFDFLPDSVAISINSSFP
jgi:hypothetical protein